MDFIQKVAACYFVDGFVQHGVVAQRFAQHRESDKTSLTFPATRWSLAGLLLLTLLSLPSVQAEESNNGTKAELQTFELRIVDLKGHPEPSILGARTSGTRATDAVDLGIIHLE